MQGWYSELRRWRGVGWRLAFPIVAAAFAIATPVKAEELVYFSFEGDPLTKGLFAESALAFVQPHRAVASGISGDTTGDNQLSLGSISDFGDISISGRAIFRVTSFGNRSLNLESVSFDIDVIGRGVDHLTVLINNQVVDKKAGLASGPHSFLIDVQQYMPAGKCFVIEVRAEVDDEAQVGVSLDDFRVEGVRIEHDDAVGPPVCWERSLDLSPLLAFYDFDSGSSRATYANPLVSTMGVMDASGVFQSGGGGYVEETGEDEQSAAHLLPSAPGAQPNSYIFSLAGPSGSRIYVDRVRFRAAGQGSKDFIPRDLAVTVNGGEVGAEQINGVMQGYEFPVDILAGNTVEIGVSIWGQPNALNGVIDEVEVLGDVRIVGVSGSVPK